MEETMNPNTLEAEGEGSHTRDEEATSGETLSDIEANEEVGSSGGGGSDSSSPLETSTPAPDTGGEGRADGSETGGPM